MTIGILIILAVFFSLSNSFWIFIGCLVGIFGLYKIIRSFPNGVGAIIVGIIIVLAAIGTININFWEFILILLASGFIEGGLRIMISDDRKE
ncbi:MAG: hypothetical protein H0Z24_01850 [Thermosipho sp. (in: Bacteria)]|nr:hypothetical protein [Thermosipho sp. (in: thermotogales)]